MDNLDNIIEPSIAENLNEETKDEVKDEVKDEIKEEINDNANDELLNDETKNEGKKEKHHAGYFSYYLFVSISAFIGFVAVFFFTRFFIDDKKNIGVIDLVKLKPVLPIFTGVVAVIIFMIISISLKKILKKIFLSEVFLYLYVGFLTTVVNIISFKILLNNFKISAGDSVDWKLAEISAFVIAVLFAFIADKIVVFKSFNILPTKLFSELGLFIGGRIFTEIVNITIMYIMIDRMHKEEFFTKLCASVVVIIFNYLISKFIIFKKKK